MSKLEEMFDIYDPYMNPLGTATRTEVHSKGLWHRTFQCWIWEPTEGEGSLLFQRRHPEKDTFPGLLDISCAGYLLAGEKSEDGIRELKEELGLDIPFSQLVPCGIFPEEDHISDQLIDREFCYIYLLQWEQPLLNYRLQEEEVTGLYRVPMEEVRHLAQGGTSTFKIHGVALDFNGLLIPDEQTVTSADFVPHSIAYYNLLFQTIDTMTTK